MNPIGGRDNSRGVEDRRAASADDAADDDRAAIAASIEHPERFAELFDRYATTIHRYLARRTGAIGVDDLLSDVFRIAFDRRHTFDLSRTSARPWLYGIAGNVIRDHRRREQRRLRSLTAAATSTRVTTDGDEWDRADARLDAAAAGPALAIALAELSVEDRETLLLHVVERLPYAEVAAALEIPVGTVRSRINRARRQLRELLPVPGQQPGDRPAMEVRHDR